MNLFEFYTNLRIEYSVSVWMLDAWWYIDLHLSLFWACLTASKQARAHSCTHTPIYMQNVNFSNTVVIICLFYSAISVILSFIVNKNGPLLIFFLALMNNPSPIYKRNFFENYAKSTVMQWKFTLLLVNCCFEKGCRIKNCFVHLFSRFSFLR